MFKRAASAELKRELIEVGMPMKTDPPLVWNISYGVRFNVKESKDRLGPVLSIEKIGGNVQDASRRSTVWRSLFFHDSLGARINLYPGWLVARPPATRPV